MWRAKRAMLCEVCLHPRESAYMRRKLLRHTAVDHSAVSRIDVDEGKCCLLTLSPVVTFCVSRRRRKMYCGHARLCVCLSAAVRPHYCMDPDVT